MNKNMRKIKIEKVTLNIGTGKDVKLLEKAVKLLGEITNSKPVKTYTNKRIPTWGLRPGLAIGCKVTLRKNRANELLKRLLDAIEFKLGERQFDQEGNLSFGIPEYIDIGKMKYSPEIGIMGLEVSVTLERPGFRIKKRKLLKRKIPKKHRITKEESIEFMKKEFNVELKGEEEWHIAIIKKFLNN